MDTKELTDPVNPVVKKRMDLLQSIRAVFKLPDLPLSEYQLDLLISDQYEDFPWDCIVYVIGHSDVRKRHLIPKPYKGLNVVSLFGTEMGTSCFTFTKPIETLFQWLRPTLTPVDIAIALNVTLRERDPHLATLNDEDAVPFLNSSVKLSPSVDHYFDKEWEFFEEHDGVCKKNGSVILYTKDGTCISLLEEHADPSCTEPVLSKTTILESVAAKGYHFPIFIDLGCNTFSGKNSRSLWEEIKASYPKGPIGGKKTRKNKRY